MCQNRADIGPILAHYGMLTEISDRGNLSKIYRIYTWLLVVTVQLSLFSDTWLQTHPLKVISRWVLIRERLTKPYPW